MEDMRVLLLEGSPKQVGMKYGQDMAGKIHENIDILIKRAGIEILEGENDVPLDDRDFIKWEKGQEKILRDIAPYLIEKWRV